MSNYEYDEMRKQNAVATMGMLSSRDLQVIPKLKAQRYELEQRILKIDNLLTLFEKNPDFMKMYDLARELI